MTRPRASSALPDVHVIVSTHTARHLARTLSGLGAQTIRPASIVVTCDVEDAEILALVESFALGAPCPTTLVQRAHTGRSRSSQVRNNGVRALAAQSVKASSVLLFLDGDCVPSRMTIDAHQNLCQPRTLVIGFRHDLTEAQTAAFDPTRPEETAAISADQTAGLQSRAARYRRQALLRKLGLAKPHKPKLLSANFSVTLNDYLAVNGFDERYQGYGQEDDDLGRRLYKFGCRPVIAIEQATTYHQYHPTRAPGEWHQSPNVALFRSGGPTRCIGGVENPSPQPPVQVSRWRTNEGLDDC